MKTAEEILMNLKLKKQGELSGITWHTTILEAMEEYANQFKKEGDAVKTVCPKCKSDDWVGMGQYRRCNDCNERWNEGQTVL